MLIKYAFRYASWKKTYVERQLDLIMRSVDFGSQILFYAIKHLILFNYSLYRCFMQMWIYGHMAFKPKGVSKRVIRILFRDLKTNLLYSSHSVPRYANGEVDKNHNKWNCNWTD